MKYELKNAENTFAKTIRLLKRLEKSKRAQKDLHRGFQSVSKNILSREARAHHIALGFLRGRTMNEMELPLRPIDKGHVTSHRLTKTPPAWDRVEELVLEHGKRYFDDSEQNLRQSFAEFRDSWTVGSVE